MKRKEKLNFTYDKCELYGPRIKVNIYKLAADWRTGVNICIYMCNEHMRVCQHTSTHLYVP